MLQLHLDFLGRQLERFRPAPPVEKEPNPSWVWKHGLTVHVARPPRARRYLLRLQTDGTVRLVIPRRGSRREGVQFLERSEPWLLKQLALWKKRNEGRQPWAHGVRFLFRGETVTLAVQETDGKLQLSFGDQIVSVPTGNSDYRKLVLDHLRRLAERELPPRTDELARLHNIAIKRVTVRAQKTRWGSCSARGTISLNWRLIQAPPSVSDYLIIHELMHRREMNHSSRYWKLVESACPDYQIAERWLKKIRLDDTYLAGVEPSPV